jgi:hypothetical protein
VSATECTPKAISHRITKLREIAKTFDTAAVATLSPVKRVRTPKAKAAQSHGDDDGDESPTKKQKTTTKPTKAAKKSRPEPAVKEEDKGEESTVQAEENASDG